ncbi:MULTISPECIES: fibronectin type III domain-containing protein [Streptomyces]|uniref:fibronectin type III domain-containing protein n=1 Tax=Streptomyces TaxID=1883 RepID=UPI0016708129|nr:fibronectin type III domain-containing protein [Streptomyces ruber]
MREQPRRQSNGVVLAQIFAIVVGAMSAVLAVLIVLAHAGIHVLPDPEPDPNPSSSPSGPVTSPTVLAPRGLAVTGTTSTTISFQWTEVENATSYKIYDGRGGYLESSNDAVATMEGLAPGTSYSYTVTAVNPAGKGVESGKSRVIHATTTAK